MEPSPDRIARLASVLALVPRLAVDVVETSDPQYAAVKRLYGIHGLRAAALVVANALVSYRLTRPGEEYWNEFADYFARRPAPQNVKELIDMFAEFLEASKGNRRLVQQKLTRLKKAGIVLQRLLDQPDKYLDLKRLVDELAAVYSGKGVEKTIVFAAKMLHYLYRAAGLEEANADTIPVPIDRRMAILTYTSGLLDASPGEVMSRYRDAAVKAWLEVARRSGIPSISLDAIVWLPAYRIEAHLRRGIDYARDEYAKRLVEYTRGLIKWGQARRIAEEIIYRGLYGYA